MTAIPLTLALAGILAWIFRMIANDSSRADLPRRPGHARPASPVAGRRAGRAHATPIARPAGSAAVPQAGAPAADPLPHSVRYPALNPRLYETGEMPGISQEAADEAWWSL